MACSGSCYVLVGKKHCVWKDTGLRKQQAKDQKKEIKMTEQATSPQIPGSDFNDRPHRDKWVHWKEQHGIWKCPKCGSVHDGPRRASPIGRSSIHCNECDCELTHRTGGGQSDPFRWVLCVGGKPPAPANPNSDHVQLTQLFKLLRLLDDVVLDEGAVVAHLCSDLSGSFTVELWGMCVAKGLFEEELVVEQAAICNANPEWLPEVEKLVERLNLVKSAAMPYNQNHTK